MEAILSRFEQIDKRKAYTISTIIMVLLLVLLAIWQLPKYQDPPPGQFGVLVSFGEEPDVGQGEEQPTAAAPPVEETVDDPEPEPVPDDPEPVEVPEVEEESQPQESKPKPADNKKVLEDQRSKELALKRKKEQEQKAREEAAEEAREKREAEAKRKAQQAAEAKKKAEEEAKRKAQAERDRKAKELRDGISGAFSKSKSQGNSGTPGDAGRPDGDPDGKALDGISTGSGEIGGGLSGRGVAFRPKISDNSNRTGDVNVKVCVDGRGRVISADMTQRGSTTQDRNLVKKAEEAAKRYRFDSSSTDKQCGTIKIKFRVQ